MLVHTTSKKIVFYVKVLTCPVHTIKIYADLNVVRMTFSRLAIYCRLAALSAEKEAMPP